MQIDRNNRLSEHRSTKTTAVFGSLFALTIPFSIAAAPAPANIEDAQAVIAATAPELSGHSLQQLDIAISDGPGPLTGPSVSVASPIDDRTMEIRVIGAEGDAQDEGDIRVFDTDSPAAKAYVQPTPNGVRLLTAISSRNAPDQYSYAFDAQPGTSAFDIGGGVLSLEQPDGSSAGLIMPAWARDAAGRELPTHYSWRDNVLTQTIDLNVPDITFPVLADPNWTYSFRTTTGNTTPAQGWTLLHNCFNCYFPVTGAPRSFPSLGSLLPLRVGWTGVADADFTCLMVQVEPADRMWRFAAWGKHVDGFGSWIAFGLHKNALNQNVLEVGAFIVNDFPSGIPNPIYTEGAKSTWQLFANNLAKG